MTGINNEQEPVDWDSLTLQAFNLRFESGSHEAKMEKAKNLALTFIKHDRSLPRELAMFDRLRNRYMELLEPE